MEKYCRARQATVDDIIWGMCLYITKATDTLKICNIYCSSKASMVTRTCLTVRVRCTLPLLFSYTLA